MPKSILVDPREVRKHSKLEVPTLALNSYTPDPENELTQYGSEGLLRMLRDMIYIREFENLLGQIKMEGHYQGIEYRYRGPAHLSIGQEATAVGQAFHLDNDDLIFGSHRSHGEILAKSFVSIHRLDEDTLIKIMEEYMEGAPLKVVEKTNSGDVKDLALDYVLYGVLAEIFGRITGFNKGLGGSMHAFFPPFGIMPNNAIVGGSAPIAAGGALFKRINRKPGIVIANLGDGAVSCGPVWEAMVFSSMDQYRTLWDAEIGGNPPIIFNFNNNFYSMGGQPAGETMGYDILARIGIAVNPEAMHSERVDGFNPLAVADAIMRKKDVLLKGLGPVLLDVITYRFKGHSPSDASTYRSKAEIEMWEKQDAIAAYERYLIDNGHTSPEDIDSFHEEFTERLTRILQAAISDDMSPRFERGSDEIGNFMFSKEVVEFLDTRDPETILPQDQSRLAVLAKKSRSGISEKGKVLPRSQAITYADAIFEALMYRFYVDPTMIAFGEENRDWGGAFGVYRGLTECLPYHRLFNSPIAEAAIVGSALGYAISGGRVVAEVMYSDFMGRAGDELFNQLAKWQSMSGGVLRAPVVIRMSIGSNYGAQHSQDWSSMVAHIPGLIVMYPATPYDAKGMLNAALCRTDPVIFFESQALYNQTEVLVEGGVPSEYYEIEYGEPAIHREGTDITIISIGPTLYRCIETADRLEEFGLSTEVIDIRFLNPLKYGPLATSARKTGRILVVSDACERGAFAHTLASNISQLAFDDLDGPVVVVGARNWITPPVELEDQYFPQPDWILDAINDRIFPLPNYQTATQQGLIEILRRNALGI